MDAAIATSPANDLNSVLHTSDLNSFTQEESQQDIDRQHNVHQNTVYKVNNKIIGCISEEGALFFSNRDTFLARFSSTEHGITEALINLYGETLVVDYHTDTKGPTMGSVLKDVYGFLPTFLQ